MKTRSKKKATRELNEVPEVVDIDDIDVPRLPGGGVQQNTEVVSLKSREDKEDLYKENLKRLRERVHTGKADIDVEEYITMYRDYLDSWKLTTIRTGNREELEHKVRNSRTNQMMTARTRKGAWIARWKHVSNFVKDLPVVGRSDIP